MSAMREFILTMGGRDEKDRIDAIKNVMLTKAHFEASLAKIKGSLDRDALEASERQAWEMLYSQDQRTILEKALKTIQQATMMEKEEKAAEDLRKAVYLRKKDFAGITKLTDALEKKLAKK
jgi:transitional endoplasmic reticulum ATPase